MSRSYDVAIRINGQLGNLQNAVRGAQRSLQNLGNSARQSSQQASRAAQNLQSRLNALNQNLNSARQFRQLNSGIAEFARQTAQARQNSQQLLSQLQAQQAQVARMRDAFQRLQQARDNRQISAAALRQGRQELKAQEQSLRQLQTQYRQAQSTAENLNSSLRQQTSTLNSLRSAFQSAGIGANDLARHEQNLQRQISQTNQNLQRQQNFDNARNNFSSSRQNLAEKYSNFQGSIDTAQNIMSPFTAAIDNAKDFEFEMSKVKSLTQMRDIRAGNLDKVNASMKALTAEAEKLGRETEYTAIQAAQMQSKLAMSGWSDKNILNAGQSIMDLATATKVELPVAADIASDLIQAFGLKVGDTVKIAGKEYDAAKHFVDTFAYATTSANTDVIGFKDTFKYAAPITKQWGLSLHEAAAAAMVTANSSIKGTQAGTAFKTGLLRLSGPPKGAADALDEMNLSMSDATKMMQEAQAAMQDLGINTNFKEGTTEGQKFSSLMSQMNEKFKDMSADEKLANINKIFGSNAAPFWAEMFANFDQYKEALKEMDAGIDGWAKDTAAVMRDNSKTQEEYFKSAADAAQRSIGQAFLPAYTEGLRVATEFATAVGNWATQHQTAVQWIGILAAGLAAVIVLAAGVQLAFAAWGFIATAIRTAATAMAFFSRAALSLIFSPVGLVLAAIALAGLYCYQNWDKVAPIFQSVANVLGGALSTAISILQPAFANLGTTVQRLGPAFSALGGVIFAVLALIVNAVVRVGAAIIQTFAQAIATAVNLFSGLGGAISSVLAGDFSGAWDQLKSTGAQAAKDIAKTFETELSGAKDVATHFFDPIEMMQNVQASGETNLSAPENQIDTSQAQAGLDALGQSAQSTADTQNNISQVGTDLSSLSAIFQNAGADVTTLQTGTQGAATELTNVQTNAQTLSPELVNLQTNLTATSPPVQQLGTDSAATSSSIQQLGSSAGNAAGSLSQIEGAAGSVANALSAKAAEIGAIHISVPTVSTVPAAANAKGGIYPRGEFLTTFAEKSPEAAIPLDNSSRAKNLWTQAGKILGILPGNATPKDSKPKMPTSILPEVLNPIKTFPEQKKIQQAQKSTSIFSRKINLPKNVSRETISDRILNPATTFPKQKMPTSILPEVLNPIPTFPQQNKIQQAQSSTSIFSRKNNSSPMSLLDKMLGGGVQSAGNNKNFLMNFGNGGGIFGKLLQSFDNSIAESKPPLDATNFSARSTLPPITISITIQGNADQNVMQEAGNKLGVELEQKLETWWRNKTHDEARRSFN